MASQRILAGAPATIVGTFRDSQGEPETVAGPVTVTVTRGDGSLVVEDVAATVEGAGWKYDLTATQTASVDLFEAEWSGPAGRVARTWHDIVGGFYFTLAELRQLPEMRDTSKYPDRVLRDTRRRVEDTFDDATGVAWVPRYGQQLVKFAGGSGLVTAAKLRKLRHIEKLTAAEVTSATFTTAGVVSNVHRTGWLLVGYEHGYDDLPADLHDAAVTYARAQLIGNRTGIPDRATSFTSAEGGTYRLATPGIGGSITGIPEVDEVLHRYDHHVPGVA